MERLTTRRDGIAVCGPAGCHECYSVSGHCGNCSEGEQQIERLCAYEDTGLTPEQVAATKRALDEELKNVKLLRAELNAVVKERDDIKAEFEAWRAGRIGVEEYYALKVQLAKVAAKLGAFEQYGTPDGFESALRSSIDNYNRARRAEAMIDELRAKCDEAKKSPWVKCSERLPDINDAYLVRNTDNEHSVRFYLTGSGWLDGHGCVEDIMATHWMQIPPDND